MSMSWLMETVDDLAKIVCDGSKVAIGADYTGVAMELTRALIRQNVKDLHVVCMPVSGLQADMMVGAGIVRTLECAAVNMGEHGIPYRFQEALRKGSIQLLEATCPAIHAALEAGRKNIPFIPLRGLIGSDLVKYRDEWKIIDNPFQEDDRIILLPAIRPDYALFHAPYADRHGNIFVGRRREVVNMSQASTHGALVTVEEVRDIDLMETEESAAGAMPALYVRGVAVAEKGTWPLGLWDYYSDDVQHFKIYGTMSKTEEAFEEYLDRFVHEKAPARERAMAEPA